MTISRRMAIGYGWISATCLVLVAWLGYHEFVGEPAEFAAKGVPNIHQDTRAELFTVCFLTAVPLLLGLGWWWMRRVLAPLETLAAAVGNMDSHNLQPLPPHNSSSDEVEKLSTAFNSMAARLDASFHRIHEFTLHASHELKTPLTVMRANLENALKDGESLPSEQTGWIDGQLDEVKRLTRIVDSLSLLTKAGAGLLEFEHQPVPLDHLVREAFEDALILAQPQSVQVTLDGCEEAQVIGDRHRLRQLLLILTDNAVKYNHPGGTITLSLRSVANHAEVRITNTSSGVTPQALENIFLPFVRGENARGNVEGCGLGLSIARWIVEAHGGSIQLIPEPGDKITALFTIPARTGKGHSCPI